LNSLLVEFVQVFRRRHLDYRELEEFNFKLAASFFIVRNFTADRSDFEVRKQAHYELNSFASEILDIPAYFSIVLLPISALFHFLSWTLAKPHFSYLRIFELPYFSLGVFENLFWQAF